MRKAAGKIYMRDLSPSQSTSKHSAHAPTENFPPSLATSNHKDTVYFTLDPEQHHALPSHSLSSIDDSMGHLASRKYQAMPDYT